MVLRQNSDFEINRINIKLTNPFHTINPFQMKPYLLMLLFPVLTFCSLTGKGQNSSSAPANYLGTWQLVSASQTRGDTTSRYDSSTIAEYKVITPHWFMYTIFNKQNNTFIGSTCGPFTADGNKMTNAADYSSIPNRKGITNTYTFDIQGNIMHHKGENRGTKIDEVWVKLY
jgi:hypothetical protein